MKQTLRLPLIAAMYCGLSTAGSAFTLDFLSVPTGTVLPPALTITVFGYGDVRFDPIGGSTLIVDDRYENDSPGQTSSPSLNFDSGEGVKVTFLGAQPIDVEFDWVGTNAGEFFIPNPGATANEFIITLNGSTTPAANNGAGLYEIGFNQVPEPSAALLGVLGATMLVIRRKR